MWRVPNAHSLVNMFANNVGARDGGVMGKVWRAAALMFTAAWPHVARADCPLEPEIGVACDVTGDCFVPWEGDGAPVLVDAVGNRRTAMSFTSMREVAVVAFSGPLPAGEYTLEDGVGGRGPVVRVAPRERTFPRQNLAGQTVPDTYKCRDTFPFYIPYVATEELFHVTLDVGRPFLAGARASIWVLGEGVPVPAGNTAPNTVPGDNAWGDRVAPLVVASAEGLRDFGFLIPRNQLSTGDRVAVQVVEPTGVMTGVLVVTVDKAETYAGCQCTRGWPPTPLAWMMLMLVLQRMRGVRQRSRTTRRC